MTKQRTPGNLGQTINTETQKLKAQRKSQKWIQLRDTQLSKSRKETNPDGEKS